MKNTMRRNLINQYFNSLSQLVNFQNATKQLKIKLLKKGYMLKCLWFYTFVLY